MKKVFRISHMQTVDNYPYGFKFRTIAHFSIEFDKKKGFRDVFQILNPKTNVLNKPKKSVWHDFSIMYENEDGHVKTFSITNISGNKGINTILNILAIYNDNIKFSPDMERFLLDKILQTLIINSVYADKYGTPNIYKDYIETVKQAVTLKDIFSLELPE